MRGAFFTLAVVMLIGAQQPPTFRSGVEVVTVDVAVLDGTGRPLAGLRADDFELLVDGQPREIVSAQFVRNRTGARRRVLQAPADAPPLVASNEHTLPGRLILLAVDRRSIRRAEGMAALRAAADFVDGLDPADRVAAVGLGQGDPLEFTTDHAIVKRRLSTLTGLADRLDSRQIGLAEALAISDGQLAPLDQAVQRVCGGRLGSLSRADELARGRNPCPIHIEQESRAIAQYTRAQAQQSVGAIVDLLRHLAPIEGPKTLILVSEGLVAEPQRIDFTPLAAAAQRARVSVYVLHAEPPLFEAGDSAVSPTLREDFNVRADGLWRLAGATGGTVFPLVGTGKRQFDRILQELSAYYLLAFDERPSDRDGRPHRISVAVRVPGTIVRARAAFEVPADASGASSTEARLVQLLRGRRGATELPLRLAAYRSRGTGAETVRTIVGVETDPSDVTFGLVVVDVGGVVATSARHRTAAGRSVFDVLLKPGRYLLRAAAIETAGRVGTVEYTIDIGLPQEGEFETSDLVLAERPPDGAGALTPIVDRTSATALVALLELYPATGEPSASVLIDVAAAGSRATVLRTRVTAGRVDERRWIARAPLDLSALAPGRYLVTATIASAPGLTVSRSFLLVR